MADRKAVIKNADMSEDMQQDAIDWWGANWVALALADYNTTFGTSTDSPIMEGDEEDEDAESNASTEPFPGMDVDPTPEAGGNVAQGRPRHRQASRSRRT